MHSVCCILSGSNNTYSPNYTKGSSNICTPGLKRVNLLTKILIMNCSMTYRARRKRGAPEGCWKVSTTFWKSSIKETRKWHLLIECGTITWRIFAELPFEPVVSAHGTVVSCFEMVCKREACEGAVSHHFAKNWICERFPFRGIWFSRWLFASSRTFSGLLCDYCVVNDSGDRTWAGNWFMGMMVVVVVVYGLGGWKVWGFGSISERTVGGKKLIFLKKVWRSFRFILGRGSFRKLSWCGS